MPVAAAANAVIRWFTVCLAFILLAIAAGLGVFTGSAASRPDCVGAECSELSAWATWLAWSVVAAVAITAIAAVCLALTGQRPMLRRAVPVIAACGLTLAYYARILPKFATTSTIPFRRTTRCR